MKLYTTWLVIVFAIWIPLNILAATPVTTGALEQSIPAQTIRDSIDQTGNFLASMAFPSGKFLYRFHLQKASVLKKKYNILRHAGAIYALGQFHEISGSPEIEDIIRNATRFMMDTSYGKVSAYPNAATIWSMPEINGRNGPPVAKLGGAGLALVALFTAAHVQKEFEYQEQMRAIGNFIIRMQKPNGLFYSKFFWKAQRPDDKWISLYYPGEAALGLLCLYQMTNESQWAQSANRSLLALAKQRVNAANVPADHWALIATQRLFKYYTSLDAKDKAIHLQHVRQIATAILDSQVGPANSSRSHPQPDKNVHGAFDEYGKTTPTATRMEGLIAAFHCLPPKDRLLKNRIQNSIEAGVAFLLRAKVHKPPHIGAYPRALVPMTTISKEAKTFNRRMDEVRIDYLQHALSALYGYLKLFP